jgi:hypothetical protein
MDKHTNTKLMLLVDDIKPDFSSIGIQTFEFQFVQVTDVNGKNQVRNCSGYDSPYRAFDDLGFRAQAQVTGDANRRDAGAPYAYSLCYRSVYTVDFEECTRMMKMLTKIRKMVLPVNAETLGQYIQMYCLALKVDGAVQQGKEHGTAQWGYDAHSWITWKTTEIQWLVDRRVGEFMEKHAPKPVKLCVRCGSVTGDDSLCFTCRNAEVAA